MSIERDDDALATNRLRQFANLGDYRLMAAMNSVIRADRDY